VYVDGELLAVTVYRKGAEAIAAMIRKIHFSGCSLYRTLAERSQVIL